MAVKKRPGEKNIVLKFVISVHSDLITEELNFYIMYPELKTERICEIFILCSNRIDLIMGFLRAFHLESLLTYKVKYLIFDFSIRLLKFELCINVFFHCFVTFS